MWNRFLWCVLAVCAGGVTTLSHAREACPAARFGGPNGQGFYMWYSPYCDGGATGLWLPGTAVAQNCPAGMQQWCVGGLGPKPKRVHANLKGGYGQAGGEPCVWNTSFAMEENPSTGEVMPGTSKTYRAKVALDNGDLLYCNLVRVKVPETTILWEKDGVPMNLKLEAVTMVGGWQVKEPPMGHLNKYKDAYLVEAPTNANKVARVALEIEEGEAIITEVVLHKDTIFMAK